MGKHFVPQRLLRAFEDPTKPGFIWLYDRDGGRPRRAAIAKTAQAKDFYDNEVELALTTEIEGPANPPLQKLRDKRSISFEDRLRVSRYAAVMLTRVPEYREAAKGRYPEVLDDTVREIREQIIELAKNGGHSERIDLRLKELEAARQKFLSEPPEEVKAHFQIPWATHRMVLSVLAMDWRILISEGPQLFMISDNPAFLFSGYGLASAESEFVLPISSSMALHGSWSRSVESLSFQSVGQPIVREINRRLASTSRFVYYHQETDWILPLLRKGQHYLSRIQWK